MIEEEAVEAAVDWLRDKAKDVADECFNGLRAWAMNKMREVVNAH